MAKNSFVFLVLIHLSTNAVFGQLSSKSLESQDSIKIIHLLEKTNRLLEEGKTKKAMLLAKKAVRLSHKDVNNELYIESYNKLGITYTQLHMYEDALLAFKESLYLSEKNEFYRSTAYCKESMSSVYSLMGKDSLYEITIKETLNMYEKCGDVSKVLDIISDISQHYYYNNYNADSISHYQKQQAEIYMRIGDTLNAAHRYSRICLNHFRSTQSIEEAFTTY